jgi:hypothetical protein
MSGASAPPKLPPLPDLPTLTRWLRLANRYQDGPGPVLLCCIEDPNYQWIVAFESFGCDGAEHTEEIPGDDKPFDAVAAARRLLAEARLAGFK